MTSMQGSITWSKNAVNLFKDILPEKHRSGFVVALSHLCSAYETDAHQQISAALNYVTTQDRIKELDQIK